MTTLTRENKLTAPTRNSHVAWTATNPVVPEGVLIIVKDRLYVGSVEYAIGDGVSNYNALRKFGEAKDADGKIDLANVVTNSAEGLLKLDANGKAPAERLYITGALAEGAIIESGENANGRYTKFADGTMICIYCPTVQWNSSVPSGGASFVGMWTYPAAFIALPTVLAMYNGYGGDFIRAAIASKTNTSTDVFVTQSGTTALQVATFEINEIAIGRWK